MPKLKKVIHVKLMKANLISVSQLCDDDVDVCFDKRQCYVVKDNGERIIIRKRSSDSYYQMNIIIESMCLEIKLHDMELWHKRLGHVNYKLLKQLRSKVIVGGIPMFGK